MIIQFKIKNIFNKIPIVLFSSFERDTKTIIIINTAIKRIVADALILELVFGNVSDSAGLITIQAAT